jgi:hypothetical protein
VTAAVLGLMMRQSGRQTAAWAVCFLAVLEIAGRWAAEPESLLRLHVPGYATAYEHRLGLARAFSSGRRENDTRPVLAVLGDSTAERGLNACSVAEALGGSPVALAVPSGGMAEGAALLSELGANAGGGELLYAVNPLNVSTYSEWIHPTFQDLVRRTDLASAAVGTVWATFGKREALLGVLERLTAPGTVEARFQDQIGLTGFCGRELQPGKEPKEPSVGERPRQLRGFATNWSSLFREQVPPSRSAELAGPLRAMRTNRRVTVVLMPFRSDFRSWLDAEYPGLLADRRRLWKDAADSASVSAMDCAAAVEDDRAFEDPVHLHERGRRFFSARLSEQLKGHEPGCPVLAAQGN